MRLTILGVMLAVLVAVPAAAQEADDSKALQRFMDATTDLGVPLGVALSVLADDISAESIAAARTAADSFLSALDAVEVRPCFASAWESARIATWLYRASMDMVSDFDFASAATLQQAGTILIGQATEMVPMLPEACG